MNDSEDHQAINDKLDAILKILNGNGKIGMCAKVEVMWSKMNKVVASVSGIVIFIVARIIWDFINKG